MRYLLLSTLVLLPLFFTNCDMKAPAALVESSSVADCGADLSSGLKNPTTIDQVTNLINALPKPLSIDCFLSALQKPFSTYAVNNQFSAQPAQGVENPRIFIIRGNLLMSVVTAGPGMKLLEMSEVISASTSVKGEVEFPVLNNLDPNSAFSRILSPLGGGTNCKGCHSGEVIYSGLSYVSTLVRPDPIKKISLPFLKYQAGRCTNMNDLRCRMLRAIFPDSTTDGNFP